MAHEQDSKHGNHHVTPLSVYYKVFAALIIGTVVTVASSYIDFGGSNNILIAMVIATVKALLVILFFMGLKYEGLENNATFFCSFLFLAIFVGLTGSDIFFRNDPVPVKVDMSELPPSTEKVDVARLLKPSSDASARALVVFNQQCVSCHGAKGAGDGPAAAAFNPKPRNFTVPDGWKNGRTVNAVVKTLSTGLGSMPNFSAIPAEDRFALAHYVRSLAASAPQDSADDVAALEKLFAAGSGKQKLPIDFALERVAAEWESAHR